jgi:hypothetical protein
MRLVSRKLVGVTNLTIAGVLLVLILGRFNLITKFTGIGALQIKGVVRDGQTGNPVAKAHVIVKLEAGDWTSQTLCYGVVTDAQGGFFIDKELPTRVHRQFHVLACGPDDSYGYDFTSEPTLDRGVMLGNVVVRIFPPEDRQKTRTRYKYDTFFLEFIGEGWNAPTHDQFGR